MARKNRVAIVYDGECWYIRRIRTTEHDLDRDEKVYRCDQPVGARYKTVDEAANLAKEYLGI